MNSRVSWSVDGIDPSVRDRAEAAARRAGMSLNDWLNANLGGQQDSPASPMPGHSMSPAAREAHDVADIHQRLDSITRQIERLAPSQPRNDGVARQLNDAISRLDARLNRAPEPAPARPQQSYPQQTYQQPSYQPSPSITPVSLDDAIAEIAARQSQLDGRAPPRPAPTMMPVVPMMAPPLAPPMPDLSGLERQLFNITNQIDALRRPDHSVEESLAAFRAELAEIRKTITEAMPRQAIESLEGEIRTLARRIEDGRQSGVDGQALAGIERALGEIYEALRALTPAEQLAGFDDAIRTLGGKIDTIAHASGDPRAMQQLEGMIDALRGVVTNVASNDALVQLATDVRSLSSNVDQLARQHDYSGSLNALEQRIAMLTTALESREPMPGGGRDSSHLEHAMRSLSDRIDHLQVGGNSAHIDSAVRTLSDRIDSLQVGGGDGSAVVHHLEQRIAHLMERMEGAGSQNNNLARVEDALADILRHLADQRDNLAGRPAMGAPAMDSGLVDAIKRELSDMRFSQSETDRRTQDSLETVHSALGHVADRLSSIEGDLRKVQSAPVQHDAPRMAMPQPAPMPRPELPNPVMMQAAAPQPQRSPMADVIIEPAQTPAPAPAVRPDTVTARMPIDASLPPDHPLEPGSRMGGRMASPSERIAASEDALSDIPGTQAESGNASTFIAAARRAAQAAASATSSAPKTGRITVLSNAAKPSTPQTAGGEPASKASRIRSLLVGVSVVVIVLSGFRLVMGMFDGGEPQATAPTEKSSELLPPPSKLTPEAQPRTDAPAGPSMMSPNPINRQSLLTPAPDFNRAPSPGPQIIRVPTPAQPAAIPAPAPAPPPLAQVAAAEPIDITGSIPPKAAKPAAPVAAAAVAPAAPAWTQDTTAALTPVSDKLPDGIGSEKLRSAALKGDPAAAYEIGLRFAEGKGIAVNLDEAAKWYERAALGGVTPAMFRLGTFYEKGLSVKKNPETARRYYMQAAERGNAKAMHNLAVLDADGGGQGPNYKSAVQWFRKAADHGVADSQFNLGILYARGIGVEQNLAESYKWFSLAAAQGDADSGRKRDDVAKRLDAQSLAAAKLAIQTFVPDTQPEGAAVAAAPAGGWDGAAPAAKPAKTAAPKASSNKRAER